MFSVKRLPLTFAEPLSSPAPESAVALNAPTAFALAWLPETVLRLIVIGPSLCSPAEKTVESPRVFVIVAELLRMFELRTIADAWSLTWTPPAIESRSTLRG